MDSKPLLASLGLMLAASTQAQPPQIWIAPDQGLQPIVLDQVDIRIGTHGFLARTRIELVFDNPNARVLEGELVFPLGPNQTVTGYALEVDGAMREGVVVPKETARVAFEDISRQQIDPGLAELTRGNVFRTRLYPIPARGKKRVAIEFEQVMDDAGDAWRYTLPLSFREPVRRFSVLAETAVAGDQAPVSADSPDAELRFEQASTVWRAQLARENVTPQRELAFRIPKQASDVSVLEAADALEPARRAILARIDTGRPEVLPNPQSPRHIALFVDASGSARDRDREREHEALSAWLRAVGNVEITLVAFRDVADQPQRFRIRNGDVDVDALFAALKALPLDGASNYGAIDFAAVDKADMAVIIGDGLDSFGSGQTDFSRAPARIAVLHAAQRADHARLQVIAQRGGSQVIDLTRVDTEQALRHLTTATWQLLAVDAGGICSELMPSAPAPVDAALTLAARCTGPATLRLRFGTPDGAHHVERTRRVGTAAPATGHAASIQRAVAQARITQLQAEAEPDVAAITALAVRHSVVTAYTSLLVLDRIEDYVRYGIEPKEAPLRAQYRALLTNQPKPAAATDDGDQTRMFSLITRWKEFRDWHGQRHAWLETLLEPSARDEAALWRQVTNSASDAAVRKQAQAARDTVDAIVNQASALSARWTRDGADADRRTAWEREAIGLMLRLDALRSQRLTLVPESAQWHGTDTPQPSVASEMAIPQTAPPPAPPPPPGQAEADAANNTLDRVEISGSRIARSRAEESPQAAIAAAPADGIGTGSPPALSAQTSLTGWNPDTPYLAALREASDPYAEYLRQRDEHGSAPAFYLDSADFFRDSVKDSALALRILSNLAEIGDENTALLRVLGYRLAQWQLPALALRPLEDALAQRPEEPQSYRDLALVLAALPQPETARAAQLLWQVVERDWHGRFPDIDLIALHELGALVAASNDPPDLTALGIPAELLAALPVGLRVVMTWDADNTDIDLWVIDPTGEAVYYSHNRGRSGGHISRDFTQGYGPEVFTIARPLPGTYRVQAHYFGDRRQSLTGPVTVQLTFQTGFGTKQLQTQATTRRLETGKQRIDIGAFRVGE